MKVIVHEKPGMVDQNAAEIVLELVKNDPSCVLGLPTGGTPEGMYSRIVKMASEGGVSFKDVNTFNLDEYVGLSSDCPQSYHYYMQTNLFEHIDIPAENTHVPNGVPDTAFANAKGPGSADMSAACNQYEHAIAEKGGIDLMILGVGVNGHIGFNEPGTFWGTGVHITELDERTIASNAVYFDNEDAVPRFAITMGIHNIMECKRILLLAKGKNKAEIVKQLIEGVQTPEIPATALQTHPDVTVLLDSKAAALLDEK